MSKSERTRKPFQSVLILYAKHHEHWTMFYETTAPQIRRIFVRHTVYYSRHTILFVVLKCII